MNSNHPSDAKPDAATSYTLHHGDYTARIITAGAALATLHKGNVQIVTNEWPDSADWFAGATLAPWVNRLDAGTWQYEGQALQAPINDVANNCANHGIVFTSDFEVVSNSADSIELTTLIHDSASYPFQVRLTVSYQLGDSGLTAKTTAENFGNSRAPFAAGFHPYLVTDQDSTLGFRANSEFTVDDRMLPIEQLPAEAPGREDRLIRLNNPEDFTDTCFADLGRDLEGFATVQLSRPDSCQLVELWQSIEFGYLQVFTMMNAPAAGSKTLVAIEPQTAPANALNTGDGLVWLEANQRWTGEWGITAESEADGR